MKTIQSLQDMRDRAVNEGGQLEGAIMLKGGVRTSFTVWPNDTGNGVRVYRDISGTYYTARTEGELRRKDGLMADAIAAGAAFALNC